MIVTFRASRTDTGEHPQPIMQEHPIGVPLRDKSTNRITYLQ